MARARSLSEFQASFPDDLELFHRTNSLDEAYEIITKSSRQKRGDRDHRCRTAAASNPGLNARIRLQPCTT